MNIVVAGAEGRMGKITARLLREKGETVIPVDVKGSGETLKSVKEVKSADGIIDFSSPEAAEEILSFAAEVGIPVVIATTGHTEKQKEAIMKASSSVPVSYSENYSEGFAVFLKAASELSGRLGWDKEIIEYHRKGKKDAPSGSALALFRATDNDSRGVLRCGRNGFCPKKEGEIGISSVRIGNTVGRHEVLFDGGKERIVLIHEALSREVFAEGAIKALFEIMKKPCGLYGNPCVCGSAEEL